MATILQINSSIFSDQGASSLLADRFVALWREREPGTEVIRRDLAADPLPHFDAGVIQALTTAPEQRTPAQQAQVALADSLIAELQRADLLVIGAPMYNFTIPSQLKAWFDRIARAGTTFRYTPNGAQGLLTGKRAVLFTSHGGVHVGQATDFVTPYVRQFLGFLGIADVTSVAAEGLNLGGNAREQALAVASRELERLLPQRAA